mgnify:CR=1 FL=1
MAASAGRRRSFALALGLAALAAVPPAIAEEADLRVGQRVRVTTAAERIVGRLVAMDDVSLLLSPASGRSAEPLAIFRSDVLGLEVSVRPSRRGTGARIGLLAGLVGAVLIGALGGEDCQSPGPNTWPNFSRNLKAKMCVSHGEAFFLSALVTLPAGALVGAAIAPGEKWRGVGVDRLAVRPTLPRAGGIGLEVAVAF